MQAVDALIRPTEVRLDDSVRGPAIGVPTTRILRLRCGKEPLLWISQFL